MASSTAPTAQMLAEAAARRHASEELGGPGIQLMQEHDKRQNFRRLIDPGIFRPNSKQVAMDSLKRVLTPIVILDPNADLQTLCTMAENVLREPENLKYQTFKRENDTIKRRLIQPKGALEYALALGFRPKVIEFQSYYVFNPNKMDDLRIGAAILREALDRETEKEGRALRSAEEQKAAAAAAAQNVMLAFMDDRRTKTMRDKRERELREAKESAQDAPAPVISSPLQSPPPMPGVGHALTAVDSPDVDQPPPYQD